jgi:4-diphosphocytidyl-2-C-methyl-D-erythritol kinase
MLVVPARAKINLALEVVGRRTDGFHSLHSALVTIDWHDLVGVGMTPAVRPAITLRVTGPAATPTIPRDAGNLAHAAAAAVQACVTEPLHIDLWIDKHLPAAAGLGGGSSDAAAVLRAAEALLGVPHHILADIAPALGSDVPALLQGGRPIVSGRGERLAALPPGRRLHIAVAIAGTSSTAETYRALRDDECAGDGRVGRVAAILRAGGHPAPADLGSSLEAAALRCNPALRSGLARLRSGVADGRWHLTGSGGAAFALAPTHAQAEGLAARARVLGFVARATATVG